MTGKPAARQTDRVKGGVIVTGSVTVLIGSQGGIACSVCPGGMAVGSPVNPQLGVNHSMQHALQHGLPQSALAMLGDQGQNTLQRLTSLREQLEKQEQNQQTEITVRHYHCDHLGTPLALTDQNQQIVWAARLDPWGNIEQEFNPHDIDQAIRLPGQHHDKETGLYYNRHRYYDPSIGSYVNQDPIGLKGGFNKSVYAHENPLRFFDTIGLAPNPLELACVAGPNPVCGAGVAIDVGTWILIGLGIIGTGAVVVGPSSSPAPTLDKAGARPSPAAENMPSPGNCGPGEHKNLQDEVNGWCKPFSTPMKCVPGMAPAVRAAIAESNRQCGMARDKINKTCFAGGDVDHRNQAIDAWRRYADCQ